MRSEIITTKDGAEIQRYHIVEEFAFSDLKSKQPAFDRRVIEKIAHLYRNIIIPKDREKYGIFYFIRVSEEMEFPMEDGDTVYFDVNLRFAAHLNELVANGTIYKDEEIYITDTELLMFLKHLLIHGRIGNASGSDSLIRFIPISDELGFASDVEGKVVVNSHFFLMDPSDIDTPFCTLGSAYGLAVEKGEVLLPPLNRRPALFVDRDNHSYLEVPSLTDLTVTIDGTTYAHGAGCTFYQRNSERCTPESSNTEIIIVGRRVVAVKKGGNTPIPMAGFIISVEGEVTIDNPRVTYGGYEHIEFAIQVGPSMVNEGKIVESLCCPFFDSACDTVAFPPTVYPLDFNTGRAGRIILGTNALGEPILGWAEGANKAEYIPGKGSRGCSLLELAQFCAEQGYTNIVNLDGGGSAQLLVDGVRSLEISDRTLFDEEAERPVPRVLVLNQ